VTAAAAAAAGVPPRGGGRGAAGPRGAGGLARRGHTPSRPTNYRHHHVNANPNNVVTVLQLLQLQPFNGLFSRTTWVSRYQIGKTYLDFTGARDSDWQWHQLGHMQVCIALQTDNHASTPPLCFLQARCPSCRPTNSVKALKAHSNVVTVDDFIYPPGNIRVFSASTLLAGRLEDHPACKN